MTMLVVNACEVAYATDVEYDVDEDATCVTVSCRSVLERGDVNQKYAVCGLIEAYFYQLNDLTEEYYDHLSVEVVEKSPFDTESGKSSSHKK